MADDPPPAVEPPGGPVPAAPRRPPRELLPVLRGARLCRGLSEADVLRVAEAVRVVRFRAGETIVHHQRPRQSMFIVASGRVRVTAGGGDGDFRLVDYLGRGEHFGEMAVLTDGHSPIDVEALMDSELLELAHGPFHELLVGIPGFAANLTEMLGLRLRWVTSGHKRKRHTTVLALVHSTRRTRQIGPLVADALAQAREKLVVVTDRDDPWPAGDGYRVERLCDPVGRPPSTHATHDHLAQLAQEHERVLVDLVQGDPGGGLAELLWACEEIWWLVDRDYAESSLDNLRRLLRAAEGLKPRVKLVWVLLESDYYSPPLPDDLDLPSGDFKFVLGPDPGHPPLAQRRSLQRLLRSLQGIRVGLALSGGGARGMAHLGVLRALDAAEIYFDLVAGTSSGALMGLAYCGGWSADDALHEYRRMLTPPRSLRIVPGAPRWYMVTMFRTHAWERMLRPYLGDCRLEQLQIPLSVVAVDLVRGSEIVRDRGDVVDAIIESINLPVISRPILREGMALVDGGVLNNLPANVLPPRGATAIVGVNLMSRIGRRFAGQSSVMATGPMRVPGAIETLLRINEVQDLHLSTAHAAVIDVMITPDTSRFEFADFSRAKELADVGQAAAEEALPQIRQVLADLDRR